MVGLSRRTTIKASGAGAATGMLPVIQDELCMHRPPPTALALREVARPSGAHMNGYRLFVAAAIAAVGPLGFIISVVQAQIQENAQIAAQGTATPFPRPAKQLHDHASGERTSARMTPIAKALTPDSIADVAASYEQARSAGDLAASQ